jgi:tRNA (guanine37-N1)-methyltransferase
MAFRVDVLTLFPRLFDGWLGESLLAKAIERRLIEVHRWDFRDWTLDKHRKVDDRPYGGGPGMVLLPQPVVEAVETVQRQDPRPGTVVMLTPRGERLTQRLVEELATMPRLLFLCGRYEGFDERVREILQPREISIGDFIVNGGEVPAMVVLEAVMRLIPGVLGDIESTREESFSRDGWLEYPQYTRPPVFRGKAVPAVLLGGHHRAIEQWRAEAAAQQPPGLPGSA